MPLQGDSNSCAVIAASARDVVMCVVMMWDGNGFNVRTLPHIEKKKEMDLSISFGAKHTFAACPECATTVIHAQDVKFIFNSHVEYICTCVR